MSVFKLLHKMIKKSSSQLHSKRINALLTAAKGLVIGKKLTLTGIARSLTDKCTPKSSIRKIDRLLGNKAIHNERQIYYKYIAQLILSGVKTPLISVDWSGTPRHNFYCLRAGINLKGRTLVLYEEVHPRELEKNTKINNNFLINLKSILPIECKPIIITDAGFRVPWFRQVVNLGWNFIGRIRNENCYYDLTNKYWSTTYDLYAAADNKKRTTGKILLTKQSKFECSLHYYKGKIKGRKHYNRSGNISQRGHSKAQAKSYRDPFVIASSLDIKKYKSIQIINIYKKRMEIEEDFRDLKSHRYGFGMKNSGTKSSSRLEMLLLIAALASLACWLTALNLKKRNLHMKFQANTVKKHNVLSVQFLACEAFRWFGNRLKLTYENILESIQSMKLLCMEGANG